LLSVLDEDDVPEWDLDAKSSGNVEEGSRCEEGVVERCKLVIVWRDRLGETRTCEIGKFCERGLHVCEDYAFFLEGPMDICPNHLRIDLEC
jgi:hypothetical protein